MVWSECHAGEALKSCACSTLPHHHLAPSFSPAIASIAGATAGVLGVSELQAPQPSARLDTSNQLLIR